MFGGCCEQCEMRLVSMRWRSEEEKNSQSRSKSELTSSKLQETFEPSTTCSAQILIAPECRLYTQ